MRLATTFPYEVRACPLTRLKRQEFLIGQKMYRCAQILWNFRSRPECSVGMRAQFPLGVGQHVPLTPSKRTLRDPLETKAAIDTGATYYRGMPFKSGANRLKRGRRSISRKRTLRFRGRSDKTTGRGRGNGISPACTIAGLDAA